MSTGIGGDHRVGVDDDHGGAGCGFRLHQGRLELGQRIRLHRDGALAPGMHHEVDLRALLVEGVEVIEVVEALAAAGMLQPVDAAEAAVVEQHDGDLHPHHHARRQLRIHHHVAAVTQHDDDIPGWLRHLHADAACDLVAHAGEAVFKVVGRGVARLPQLVEFPRQAAGSPHQRDLAPQRPLHGSNHLRVRGALGIGGCGIGVGRRHPRRDAVLGILRPGLGCRPSGEIGGQRLETHARIGDERQCPMLGGIEHLRVQPDDGLARILEQRP